MARVTAEKAAQTRDGLLEAARGVLVSEGFSGLSTRRVAEVAKTQMSQIQYHFGSKEGLLLALFEDMNARLVARQKQTFDDPDLSIGEKWRRACDYLEEDVASGYVRVLQELIAVGWSNDAVGAAVRGALAEWRRLILGLVAQFEARRGPVGPLSADQTAALVSAAFLGAEALILLGDQTDARRLLGALRQVGVAISAAERADGQD